MGKVTQWKPVIGHEDGYEVSENGEIRNKLNLKVLKATLNKDGYPQLSIQGKTYTVHRIVALAFLSNPEGYKEINHIDANKKNNSVTNLEWCNHSQNMAHAYRSGCFLDSSLRKKGEILRKYSITNGAEKRVQCIDSFGNITTFKSLTEASRATGSSLSHISECCLGKRKRCNGYEWRCYEN